MPTISATKTAATEANAYKLALEAKRVLGRKGVPNEGRFLIASPEYLEVLMLDEHFIKQGDLSQEMVQQGVVGRIAGFNVFESNNMDYESTTRVSSKKTTTEFIAGHPNWCHRVMEWRPLCTCRICPAPASTSAHPLCRAARCMV